MRGRQKVFRLFACWERIVEIRSPFSAGRGERSPRQRYGAESLLVLPVKLLKGNQVRAGGFLRRVVLRAANLNYYDCQWQSYLYSSALLAGASNSASLKPISLVTFLFGDKKVTRPMTLVCT